MGPAPSRRERRHGPASASAQREIDRLIRTARDTRAASTGTRALRLYERALAIDPNHVDALCLYADAATALGRPDVGVEAARRAAELRTDRSDALEALGRGLRHLGDPRAAIGCLGRSLELEPLRATAMLELVMALLDVDDAAAAESFIDKALEIDDGSAIAQTVLGRLYAHAGQLDDAMAAFERAVARDPACTEAHTRLGNLLRDAGDPRRAIASFERALHSAPDRADLHSSLLLTLQCADDTAAAAVAERHRAYGRHFAPLLRPFPAVRASGGARRLRIGYVSSGFRRHAVTKFFEPLLTFHDTSRFDVHCYFTYPFADAVTERLRARAEHFMSICGMRDGHVAAQMRRDGIDILVDLDGHTLPNRLPVFFLRPAPIQVTWLGYLGTTGVPTIDFRLTDPWADPPDATDALHTERLWRLARPAWSYAAYEDAPQVGGSPSIAKGHATFVTLANPGKVNGTLLEWWARILRAVPASRLVMHVLPQPSRVTALERFFAARDIAPERLRFVPRQSIPDYLATFAAADIALDTWPCAGGTTTCDALWMGLPVVTITGESSYSRTGASMLTSVGLPDLVTTTPDAYVSAAAALAVDEPRRVALRATLRPRMQACPLMDQVGFARAVEAAFSQMWAQRAASTA